MKARRPRERPSAARGALAHRTRARGRCGPTSGDGARGARRADRAPRRAGRVGDDIRAAARPRSGSRRRPDRRGDGLHPRPERRGGGDPRPDRDRETLTADRAPGERARGPRPARASCWRACARPINACASPTSAPSARSGTCERSPTRPRPEAAAAERGRASG